MKYWTEELSFIAGALGSFLQEKNAFDRKDEVANYVSLCMAKGFCKTEDEVRLCAERYLAGKRAVTPPGTTRRKKLTLQQAKIRSTIPDELRAAVAIVMTSNEKAVTQYRTGNEKAVNALIGQVMRLYKTDAVIVKELLLQSM